MAISTRRNLTKPSAEPVTVSIVLPAYNEAENLPFVIEQIDEVMADWEDWELLVVDDGSTDDTLPVLQRLGLQYRFLRYLSFSRNFGHQAALRAGYEHALGECVISLDADGQHPPHLIPHLIEHWQRGCDVVTTRRLPDASLPVSKRLTSSLFYRILRSVSRLNLQEGEADFRLLDRKVVDALKQHRETDLFLRGMVVWMGFQQHTLPYQPAPRFGGRTKYSMGKMLRLALSGITSFTTRPLYLSVVLGFAMSVISGLYGLVVLCEKYFTNRTVSGWTSIVLLILLIGGFQFIMMGIIGIYLGKTFEEAKGRPSYLIAQTSELMTTPSYA